MRRTFIIVLPLALFASATVRARGERDLPSEDKPAPEVGGEESLLPEWYSLHYQFTGATQYHPSFSAKYSGQNSLSPDAESATAFVTTLYADLRLWRGGGRVVNEGGPNELAGTRDRDVLAVTVGRFSVMDVVDGNRYANDATTEFFNWALFASGAYDYPADTRGYTYGALADLAKGWWSVRGGIALEPYYANLARMDWRILKSHGLMAEYEARYALRGRPGASSLLLFWNTARMGSYEQVLADPAAYGNNVAATRADGRNKYGFALSVEQQLTHTMGAFMRLSWNDGHNESWAFTEIDRSLAVGATQNGRPWRRPLDIIGVAVVVDGLSPWHKEYLEGGGYGFIIGDGALNYGPEVVGDVYYKVQLTEALALSAIYQPIVNPAYNRDRGPVQVFSARLHVAF